MASSQYHSGPKWLRHASKSPCNWWKTKGAKTNKQKPQTMYFCTGQMRSHITHIKGIFLFFLFLVECLRKATQSKQSHLTKLTPHWRKDEGDPPLAICDWLPVRQTLVSSLHSCWLSELAKPSHFL